MLARILYYDKQSRAYWQNGATTTAKCLQLILCDTNRLTASVVGWYYSKIFMRMSV